MALRHAVIVLQVLPSIADTHRVKGSMARTDARLDHIQEVEMSHRDARRVAAGLLAVALLGACSGSDSATPPTTTGAPATTEAAAPGTTTATATTVAGEPGFTFGYLRPGAGLLLDLSRAQESALNLAIDDINAGGGVNGAPAALITMDEPADGNIATAVNDLLDQGANMILGPVGSTAAKAALAPLAARGAVACSASATTPELTTLDTANSFYRTAMSDSYTLEFVADELTKLRDAAALPEGQMYRVSILARGDDYGINVGNGLTATLLARGIDASVLSYNPRRVTFQSEAATIAAAKPDVVVLVAYGEAPRQIDSLVAAGVPSSKIVGLDGLFNPLLAQRSFTDPAEADGLRVLGSTGDRAFIDRLSAVPDQSQLVYGAQMYDCAISAALAANAAKSSDPASFGPMMATVTGEGRGCSTYDDCLSKLTSGEDIDYLGASGEIAFDANGDASEVRFTLATFNAGVMSEVSSTDLSLSDLRQQEALASAILVSRLQQVLTALGYYSGPIDGQLSDELTVSIVLLQNDLGVPPTGVYDEATDAALRAKHGTVTGALNDSVIGIQILLTELGFYTGPIDGLYSRATIDAIKALQRSLGVPETGIIDAATLRAAYEQGVISGTPGTTLPPDTTVPPTVPPTTVAPDNSLPPVVPPDPAAPSVLEMLQADPQFSTLVELITAAGFTSDADVLGPLTVFAPTNDAFDALDPADLEALRSNPELLKSVLAYHLVEQSITLDELATLTELGTVHGELLTITVDGDIVRVNGAATLPPAQVGRNGVIIAIDAVLMPVVTLPG
jgi:branched-chain amino acid transport system substrate-binding protein